MLVLSLIVYSKWFPHGRENVKKLGISRLDETLNDFVFSNATTKNTRRNEALESKVKGHHEAFEWIVDIASQHQVIGSNTDGRIRNAVDKAVIVVENRMYDAILKAKNNVVNPRSEMAVRSITGSSGNGLNSLVQNSDRRNFTGNTETTPLRSSSSRLYLNFEQDELDETGEIDKS